ncbi:MAG TPA: efflux RND transporter periplasmic adaptor subunit [Magnetococcales bacterium]|nr:efflux RND transporter periplasmic adaptor subunit [Magnetococcales bacterium]
MDLFKPCPPYPMIRRCFVLVPALLLALVVAIPGGLAIAAPLQTLQDEHPRDNAANRGLSPGHLFQPSALRVESLRGQILPRDYTTLATELPARILQISVSEGGRFKAGDILVRLDCSLQQAQLQKARAARAAAEKIASVNAKLAEMKSMGNLEVATSVAEAAKAQAEESLWNATVSKCLLAAPFSGRVAEQKAREHQYLQAGQPILEILDDSRLEVEFIAPSSWLAWIKPGLGFVLHGDETERDHAAQVLRIGARVDPVSQSIKITGKFVGNTEGLLAGMSGRVVLDRPVKTVPSPANPTVP